MESYATGALDRVRTRTASACLADVNARLQAENIQFDTDKAIIKPESHRILDEIAQILSTCEGSAFEVAGHSLGCLEHIIEGFHHILGSRQGQEKHQSGGIEVRHIIDIKHTRAHHIGHTELDGSAASLELVAVEEIHIAKAQVTGQQDVQNILAAKTLLIPGHHIEHEYFRGHIPGQATLFIGGRHG